ncbi:hypothetical protein D3C80_517120 [compost metagenome]
MGCDHHIIEFVRMAVRVGHRHAVCGAADRGDRSGKPDRSIKVCGQARDIFPAAAFDGAPLRPAGEKQQTVVDEEAQEGVQGVIMHFAGRRRPDGGSHRHQVIVDEGRGVACLTEIVTERDLQHIRLIQKGGGLLVEFENVAQHGPEAGPDDVSFLPEKSFQAGAAIFEPAITHGCCKRHVRSDRRHVQMFEQGHQVWIIGFIIDDEAGIDCDAAALYFDIHGIGMTTQPVRGFVKSDIIAFRQ